MGESLAKSGAMTPEARLARALNLAVAGALVLLCLLSLAIALKPMPPHPADYGEGRGWGLVLLVVAAPFAVLFWLAAEGFRRGARWRWVAQLAALSPLWIAAIAEVVSAVRRLR